MRIMHVLSGAEHGGAETYFVNLISAFARAGLPQLAAIRRHPARAESLRRSGVEVAELGFRGQFDPLTRRALAGQARRFDPQVVLCWMSRASRIMPTGPYLKVGRIGGYYDIKYYRTCDHLACITPKLVERMIEQGWPAGRAHYLPNFTRVAKEIGFDRAQFDTPAGAPLLLALGRLHPAKGLDTLLHALARIPSAYLWIAGEGPSRQELESLTGRLGLSERVRFLGWRNDRTALLRTCDLCVFPSRSEAFGTVTLEAWAHERPLVAAAADGPAAFIEDGQDGLLVPVDDAGALAAALQRVIADPALARRLAARGHERYENEFTESAIVARWQALFRRLLADPEVPVSVG